ncbi:MAG: ComF family protein [Campylobacterota bacterium]
MRCLICAQMSLSIVCSACSELFLTPKPFIESKNGLEIIHFYNYSDIAPLLRTKHTPVGHRVYHYLARNLFQHFQIPYTLLPIDYAVKSGYNHSAVIAKHAGKDVKYAQLKAQNTVNYAGKSLQFRMQHPRDFIYLGKGLKQVVLVDDIYTTATTLSEAKKVLKRHGVQTLFALTLAH